MAYTVLAWHHLKKTTDINLAAITTHHTENYSTQKTTD